MRFRALPFDDPVVTDLIERVQQEYVLRYGGPDATPVDPAEFTPPAADRAVHRAGPTRGDQPVRHLRLPAGARVRPYREEPDARYFGKQVKLA